MTPDFNAADVSTWPQTLRVEHMALIYDRKAGGIQSACAKRSFVPAPVQRKPYGWRKVDVMRHLGLNQLQRSA